MSAMLPFNAENFLQVFGGKEMSIVRNRLPSPALEPVARVKFSEKGFSGDMVGLWAVEDGHVILKDQWGKPVMRFFGLETRNSSVFLVGEPFMEAHLAGFTRAIMYPYVPLGDSYRICISSHIEYDDALTRLLRSLGRAGISKENVIIVIGGAVNDELASMEVLNSLKDGWKCTYTRSNLDGFTGLLRTFENYRMLLLHDTCEVADNFKEVIAKADVGLDFDMVLPMTSPSEIGLYSSSFVRKVLDSGVLSKKPVSIDAVKKISTLFLDAGPQGTRHVSSKDVYGTGTTRDVLYVDSFGIRKYRRAKGTQAKP